VDVFSDAQPAKKTSARKPAPVPANRFIRRLLHSIC